MSNYSWVGFIAALCTTFSFLPQVIVTIRTRDTAGISLSMYCIFTTGVLAWLIYGIIQMDWPMIMANSITLLFSSIILILKLKEKQPTAVQQAE